MVSDEHPQQPHRRPGGDGVYFPPPPADAAAMEAKHDLADLVRQLIEDVLLLDAAAAGADAVVEATAGVERARAALAALPSLRGRPVEAWPEGERPLIERGPFVGRSNPIATPLHLERDGEITRGWAVHRSAVEGGVGDLHGGVVAGVFDDLLGAAQMVGPVTGRTGTLTVRFRSPSPVGQRIDYEARLDRVEGRKAFCSGTARAGDVLLAEAEAIFVAPRDRRLRGDGARA